MKLRSLCASYMETRCLSVIGAHKAGPVTTDRAYRQSRLAALWASTRPVLLLARVIVLAWT